MCWDIVLEGRARRQEFEEDLAAINAIAAGNQWQLLLPCSIDNYLIWQDKTIIITEPSQRIVFATRNMLQMNGYLPEEVIGFTPRIFQGDATTTAERMPARTGVADLLPFETIITNYRKDGSLYKCQIQGFPVYDHNQQLVNFIAIENTYHERTTRN